MTARFMLEIPDVLPEAEMPLARVATLEAISLLTRDAPGGWASDAAIFNLCQRQWGLGGRNSLIWLVRADLVVRGNVTAARLMERRHGLGSCWDRFVYALTNEGRIEHFANRSRLFAKPTGGAA